MSYQIILDGNTSHFSKDLHPKIYLEKDKMYEMALVGLETYYSIPNITSKNNIFRYSTNNGRDWKVISFPEGSYGIHAIDDFIRNNMGNDRGKVSISVNENTFRTEMEVAPNYQVNFPEHRSFESILGFNKRVYNQGKHVSENIINILDVNSILVYVNIISGSYINGKRGNILYSFFPNVNPGYKIIEKPHNLIYLPIYVEIIDNLEVKIIDQEGKLINLRGEKITMRLHIREKTP